MPELPEVQTVVNGLNRYLVGHQITDLEFDWPKTIHGNADSFRKVLIGAKVISVERRAKLIIIKLNNEHSLLIHLKMTGQVVYKSTKTSYGAGHPNDSLINQLPDSTTRIKFSLDDGAELYFNDVRKFGWVEVVENSELAEHGFIKKLGPEPLEISSAQFLNLIKRHPNSQIKARLLDQSFIAGVGNIYADESLWKAKIHPQTKIGEVEDSKLRSLFEALTDVLKLSIKKGGSSSANYVKVDGKVGSYLSFANVYKKEGQPCAECRGEIIRIVAAGRGTRICPKCQKQSLHKKSK